MAEAVPDHVHDTAAAIIEMAGDLDVPVDSVSRRAFRDAGHTVSNRWWSSALRLAVALDTRQGIVPQGHHVRGTSTLTKDAHGNSVWVKSERNPRVNAVETLIARASELKPLEPVPAPTLPEGAGDFLNAFIAGDMHMGLYCAARVGGHQWGRAEALAMGQKAIELLVQRMPPAREAAFIDTGDWLHASGPKSTTVKGTPVDTDGLFHEALIDAYRLKEYMIRAILRRHELVHIRSSKGNHGGTAELAVDAMIAARFADDPRVDAGVPVEALIDPRYVTTLEFGRVLLAFAHGDKAKITEVLGMVSNDHPEAWGRTLYRWAIGGHLHHYATDAVHGGAWETYPILAPPDQWHTAMPWRSIREMHATRYHREYGLAGRQTVNAAELRAILDGEQRMAA